MLSGVTTSLSRTKERREVSLKNHIFVLKALDSFLLSYRCYFQEIWLYKMSFVDFKVTNLQQPNGKSYNPYITIGMPSKGFFSMKKSVESKICKQTKNPTWEVIKGYISFKGALFELEDQNLDLNIYDSKTITKDLIQNSVVPLTGISKNGSIRVPVKVKLNASVKIGKQIRSSARVINQSYMADTDRGVSISKPRELKFPSIFNRFF